MANKIGVVLALDGEKEFSQGMKNAQESTKLCDQALKNLKDEYKENANSLEALSKKQEALTKKQEAYKRTLDQAKNGQKHAVENYKKCGKALEDLRKDLDKAEDALKDMEKAGDTTSKAYLDQKKAVENLQKAVEKQATEYAKAEGNITKWDTKVSKAEADVRKNSKAVDQNAKYLDEAKDSADHCATSIDAFGREVKDAGDNAKAAGDGVKSLGEELRTGAIRRVGEMATEGVKKLADAAVEAAKKVVEVGSDFEASMSKVEALSGAPADEMDKLSKKAQELGASTRFSAKEVADGFSYMALAGWDTSEMLSGIDGILDLAAASEMDLAEASDIVTDNLSAFGLEAKDSKKLADELAFAQANSNTTTKQLAEAFGNCAANMNAAGQDVETTTSFLEAFANQGIKGSEAGTKLSAIMRDIAAKMQDGKIQIGDTAVAVTDANGNFRDLTDILADVESATNGMGDAERASALQTTFTSRSVGGLNMILAEGMDTIAGYEEALRKSDGTAVNTANTMQNNLKGAVTELNSAAEGLGIALYNQVSGPLTSAVDLATSAISGITKAITPEKTELETFIEDIERGNAQVQGLLDSAEKDMQAAESKVGELEAYKDTILELQDVLNNGGELDTFQLYQMQNAVNAVKDDVPGIAENFDAVTGKIDLSTTAIENMFKAAEQGAMSMAYQKAMEQELTAVAEARINQAKATAAVREATEKLNEAERKNEETLNENGGYGKYYNEVLEYKEALGDANKALDEATKVSKEAEESYKNLKSAADDLADEQGELADEMNGNATATEGARNEHIELKKAQQETAASARGAASALSEEADSAEDAAEEVKNAAKAQYDSAKEVQKAHEDAAQAITDAYEDAKEAVEKAFDINPFSAWEQNEENGIGKFQESLDSQVSGLTKYSENLQTVSDHVGKEITPEFLQYIEDMGTDGAQLMQELARAFEKGDTGKVEKLMSSYTEAMDKRDEIAKVMAADKLAAQVGAKELGSTEIEWQGVDNAIDYLQQAGGTISEETLSAFEAAEEAAKEAGVKIPDGLISGIESGDDPTAAVEHATEMINAALAGQGQALAEIAKGMGITVGDEYTAAIEAGGASAQEAMAALFEKISEAAGDAESTVQEAGETIVDTAAGSIENSASSASSSGAEIATQAASGAKGKTGEMQSAGSSLALAMAQGIQSQNSVLYSSGSMVAQSARSGASGVGTSDIGYNLAMGIKSGIESGRSSVANALVALVNNAKSAGEKAAGIASPSKVFRDAIGKQLGAGVAVGIKQSTKDTTEAAQWQMNRTLAALQAWTARNKKKIGGTGQQWADNITYAWQKLADVEVKNNFGISKTKKSGKNTTNKTTEEYYNDIYRAAQQYIRNVQSLYDVSDQQQLAYWQKVKAGLKRGTQAWYDASAEIRKINDSIKEAEKQAAMEMRQQILSDAETYVKEQKDKEQMSIASEVAYWRKIRQQLKRGTEEWKTVTQYIIDAKKQIGSINAADSLLDNYTTYYDLSLKAEMAYWNKIRLQYAVGTENRIEADRKYLDAKQKYNEKLKDIEDDYAAKIEDANKRYTDALESRKSEIMSAYDLFDYFESSSASGQELLYNLQTQAAGYEEWNKSIDDLANKGILSGDLMQQLIDKGPNSIANVKALLTLTNDQLAEYQKAYDAKEAAAQKRAEKDTEDLKSEVDAEIADLNKQRSAELAEINKSIDAGLLDLAANVKSIAEDQTAALVAAFTAVGSKLEGSVGTNVKTETISAAGASQGLISAARSAQAKQNKGMDAGSAVEAVELYRDLNTAKKKAEASQTAVTAAEAAVKKAQDALTKAQKTLDTAKANKKKVDANKKSTAAQKTNAKNAVTNATTSVNSAKTKLADAKQALADAKADLKAKNKSVEEIRKLISAAGYRSGTRRLDSDGLIWMDEEGPGSELIVRKSDNAILTRAKPGDSIIPANLVNNLWKWGAIDPTTLNTASMASLNQKLLDGYVASTRASAQQNARMDQMLQLMTEFLPYLADRMTVPIESRSAVAVMSDDISRNMASRARRRR